MKAADRRRGPGGHSGDDDACVFLALHACAATEPRAVVNRTGSRGSKAGQSLVGSVNFFAGPPRILELRPQIGEPRVPQVISPTVSTVLVGPNDVARSGFDAATVRCDPLWVAENLGGVADIVLLGRLQDPSRMLRLPGPMRRLSRERVAVVNPSWTRGAHLPRVHVLDLDQVDGLRAPAAWAVDRAHPNAAGHVALALAAAAVVGAEGYPVGRGHRHGDSEPGRLSAGSAGGSSLMARPTLFETAGAGDTCARRCAAPRVSHWAVAWCPARASSTAFRKSRGPERCLGAPAAQAAAWCPALVAHVRRRPPLPATRSRVQTR